MPTLGSLIVDLQANTAKFRSDLQEARASMDTFAKQTAIAGSAARIAFVGLNVAVLAAGAALASAMRTASLADDIGKLSARTSIASETLSALRFNAEVAGSSFSELGSALKSFQESAVAAASGSKQQVAAFQALGISSTEIKAGLTDVEGLFRKTIDRFSGFADGANKTAIATKIFGGSIESLGSLLNEGADGIARARAELERYGGVIGSDLARQSKEFNENLARFKLAGEAASIAFGRDLLPTLTRFMADLVKGRELFGSWTSALYNLGAVNPFRTVRENIVALNADVEKLLANQARAIQQGRAGAAAAITPALDVARKQIEFLKFQERNDALSRFTGEQFLDARDLRRLQRQARPDAPTLSSGSDDSQQLLKRQLQGQLQDVERAMREEETMLRSRQEALRATLDANLISFQEYYGRRADAQAEATAKSIALVDQDIAALRAARAKLAKGSDQADIDNRIAAALDKRAELEAKAAQAALTDYFALSQAAQNYRQQIDEIRASVLELRGDLQGAAGIRFDIQNRAVAAQAANSGDTVTTERLSELRSRTVAQAGINELTRQSTILQEQLANTETRIRTDRELGVLSELDGLRRATAARQETVRQLTEISDAWQKIVADSGDPRLIQDAENFRVQVETLGKTSDLVAQKFRQIGEAGVSQFFEDMLNGTKSVSDAFRNMGNSILQEVNRLVAQDLASKLFKAVASGGSGSGGSGGGLISSIFGFLFGGARAYGGPVGTSQAYLVGERGPELFVPSSRGTIVPNGSFGGGITINVSVQGPVTRETQTQIATEIASVLTRAKLRNG